MTTAYKDITDLVNLRCSSIHFLELDTLLKKLDNEDLDVLYAMLEETYEYDKGYADGYDDGYSTEE